jgi:hypothetical protein
VGRRGACAPPRRALRTAAAGVARSPARADDAGLLVASACRRQIAIIFEFTGALVLGRVSQETISGGLADIGAFTTDPEFYAYGASWRGCPCRRRSVHAATFLHAAADTCCLAPPARLQA